MKLTSGHKHTLTSWATTHISEVKTEVGAKNKMV